MKHPHTTKNRLPLIVLAALAALTAFTLVGCPQAILTGDLEQEFIDGNNPAGGRDVTTYTVTYDANNATTGTVPDDAIAYQEGDTVTVLGNTGSLTRDSYTYVGWNTAADGSGSTYVADNTFEMGTADVTLYALWTTTPEATYTVTYLANEADSGNVPVDNNEYHAGDTVTVLGNTGGLVRSGYQFSGWNDGISNVYVNNDTFTMGTSDVMLSVEWAITYSVTYIWNGGSGDVPLDSTAYVEGATFNPSANTGGLTKGGSLVFAYWNTSSDGSGELFIPGRTYSFPAHGLALYAIYIGDNGPSGGYLFYDKGNDDNGWRYLEAAPDDWDGTEDPSLPWGGRGTDIGGGVATNAPELTGIGEGKVNTAAIVDALGDNGDTPYAVQRCAEYSSNGYADWFLPSKDELNQMYSILRDQEPSLGGFADALYWSSSESGSDHAWLQDFSQDFSSGIQSEDYKDNTRRVRACRAFTTENQTSVVHYSANDATHGSSPTDSAFYAAGDSVLILDNTGGLYIQDTENRNFIYWNTAADGSGDIYVPGDTVAMGDEDLVLYAQFIGDPGPAGGVVFYNKGSYTDGWRYLEAAPASTEGQKLWGSGGIIVGAEGVTIGTGIQNTIDIIEAQGVGTGTAGQWCDSLVFNDYDDWFLPSEDELNEMFRWKYFIGGFSSTYSYFSSTEVDQDSARAQSFSSGTRSDTYKNTGSSMRERPVRAF